MTARPPFVDRRKAYIGEPVVAADIPNTARQNVGALKDFRFGNLVGAHTGYPYRDLSLDNNNKGRWHLCLPGALRPDAATESRRRYAIQMIPWHLGVGHLGATRTMEWVEDQSVPSPPQTVHASVLAPMTTVTTTPASSDDPGCDAMRTWTRLASGDIIGATPNPAIFRHSMIATAWWWPAHLGVYEIPHDITTHAQQVVPPFATQEGSTARGWQALNADRSWGSLLDIAGRVADGGLPAGRRCLYSFMHGCGLFLSPVGTVSERHVLYPRAHQVPGIDYARVRPAWVITCDTADMFVRWQDPATGTMSQYLTTGLEAETMVYGDAIDIAMTPAITVDHEYGWNVARGELVIHSSFLFEWIF